MFKVDDIVTLNLERKTRLLIRFKIIEFRDGGTVLLQIVNEPDIRTPIETLSKYMVLDVNYMRRMKLNKICSKLVK